MLGYRSIVAIRTVWRARAAVPLFALLLIRFVDGAAQPAPICADCDTHAVVAAGDAAEDQPREFADGPDCGAELRPLTSIEKRDFDLVRLQAFLDKPQKVEAHANESTRRAPAVGPSDVTIELAFQLRELSYYKATRSLEECDDSVRADMHVRVRVGDDLLRFEGDGVLWKRRHDLSAIFHADADLSSIAGTFAPEIDEARVHAPAIELSMFVAPDQIRGSLIPSVMYFANEAQRQRRFEGQRRAYREQRWWAGWAFPAADRCGDSALPFAHDEPIEQLHGKSADQVRAQAAVLLADAGAVDAVWRDGRETRLAVNLGESIDGTVCLQSARSVDYTAPRSALALSIPVAARLRTADGRIDMPLDQLFVSLDGNETIGATLRGWIPTERLDDRQRAALDGEVDLLDARVVYDVASKPARFSGIVNFQKEDEPQHYRWTNCIAFPPGSKLDAGQCRYMR